MLKSITTFGKPKQEIGTSSVLPLYWPSIFTIFSCCLSPYLLFIYDTIVVYPLIGPTKKHFIFHQFQAKFHSNSCRNFTTISGMNMFPWHVDIKLEYQNWYWSIIRWSACTISTMVRQFLRLCSRSDPSNFNFISIRRKFMWLKLIFVRLWFTSARIWFNFGLKLMEDEVKCCRSDWWSLWMEIVIL